MKPLFEEAMEVLTSSLSQEKESEMCAVSTDYLKDHVEEVIGDVSREDVAKWMNDYGFKMQFFEKEDQIAWSVRK